MLTKVNNSPTYYENALIYSTYRETVYSLVCTLKNAYLLLLLQLEKSTILRNLWNVTPVQRKVCVFQPAQRENAIFLLKVLNVFRDSVRSVLKDGILAVH